MFDIDIKGKKFRRILRLSEDENEIDSFRQQRMTTDACAERFGVVITETKELAGCSATTGEQVETILELIRQKIDGEDFDGFILDSYSRFARSEVDEARLYAECRDANLLILTDKEGLMMGQGTWAKRGAATDQNEGYARDMGRHVNRSVVQKILKGEFPPTISFPWGLDREYYDPEGKAVFRVRKLEDGRRAVLDPDPPHALRYYIPSNVARLGVREDEHSFKWVPGAEELQAAAKAIFRMHYIEHVGANRICARLNKLKIASKTGKLWSISSVKRVLQNPIWIGLSVGFVRSTGRHCERDKTGVKMFAVSRRPGYRLDKKRRKKMVGRMRPTKDWIIAKQPKLETFLDEDVRSVVQAEWNYRFENNGQARRRSAPRRKLPPMSRYFLSGLLCIKSDSTPMIGCDGPTRRGDDVLRYYITRREVNQRVEGAPTERVRADLVEDVVKNAIKAVLSDFTIHSSKVTKFIEEKKRELRGRIDNSPSLRDEKAALEHWYRSVYSVLGSRGKEVLLIEAQRAETRLNQIDLQLREFCLARPEYLDSETDEIIKSVRTQFGMLASVVDGAPSEALRNLAAAFCSKLTFDPQTRVVDIEVSLPSWALTKRDAITNHVGINETSASRCFEYTTIESIVLSRISCGQTRLGQNKPCFICSRSRKDAA